MVPNVRKRVASMENVLGATRFVYQLLESCHAKLLIFFYTYSLSI